MLILWCSDLINISFCALFSSDHFILSMGLEILDCDASREIEQENEIFHIILRFRENQKFHLELIKKQTCACISKVMQMLPDYCVVHSLRMLFFYLLCTYAELESS